MASEVEYELTFLAKRIPEEIAGMQGKEIHDIMVPEAARHPHLRLRRKDETYVITKKVPLSGTDSTEMLEETIPLEKEEFEALAKCSTKDIHKTRYNVVIGGHSAEVDVFKDKLGGLVIIDFEFSSSEKKQAFKAPEICLANISQDEAFAGGILAGKSYEDIAPNLAKYGYVRIGES